MKFFLLFAPLLLLTGLTNPEQPIHKAQEDPARIFSLQYMKAGFGSNRYNMQPVFNIRGHKFIYTSEEVWIMPGQKNIARDTLLTGQVRESSFDSLINLIKGFKGTYIQRSNPHIMSGSASYITIHHNYKKLVFDLHNDTHPTADSIVAILNTYIPDSLNKLTISH
ncbi:MAG: hypothetical protein NTW29_00745 [Bacteroidetes bacterium]|nr:hypothetical protein [Bacteroidota bacterium]